MEDIINQIINIAWIILGVVAAGAILFFVYMQMKFKIRVTVKDYTQGKIFVNDRAREKNVDGVTYWKLMKLKKQFPVSGEHIYTSTRGRPYAFFHRIDEDTFVPIKDDVVIDPKKNDDFAKTFDPLPSSQKANYLHQIRKNERYRKSNITDLVAKAAPYVAMIMIITVFMVFFSDTVAPINEMADKIIATRNAEIAQQDKLAEALNRFADYIEDEETISLDENSPREVEDPVTVIDRIPI